jgi:dienelactone hydrolase
MFKKLTSVVLALCMMATLFGSALALNSTCETGNEATFETLQEAHKNAPEIVKTYEGNDLDTMTKTAKVFGPHPALDMYPEGTTFVYRSPDMFGGRAAARLNTNLIVYADQHFASKDEAYAYLQAAGFIDIINEAVGSIVLVTPIGDTFGSADVASYYALQTAMCSQKAYATQADGSNVYYADAEYFGGYGYIYFVGVDGGATFFNNYLATTFDYVSRIAGALLVGGDVDEIRTVATFVPVYLVNATDRTVEKYKTADDVNAQKGANGIVTYYDQAQPLKQVVLRSEATVDLKTLISDAYYNLFIQAMRVPVVLQAMYSAGTPYSGYNFDEAPYSLCERNALINGVTENGIYLISHQGEDRFAEIKTEAGEYLDTWYEYLPEEVLNNTAPAGSVPLILGNHGGGDDPRLYVDEMGLLSLAGDERVAVVAADHQNIGEIRGEAFTALVEYMLQTYPALDPSRVYAIGYSMGGGATYSAGYYNPKLFAAIAPIAGTNIEPTEDEVKNFSDCHLPIYLSTSDYDVRRLQTACGRINDNLANQVLRWSGFNGVDTVTLDFDTYPLSGFKGDEWKVETLNNEHLSYTWYLNDKDGVPMVALNYVKDLVHALYPEYATIAWDYMKQFSRNQETGAIVYNPYAK